MIESKNIQTMGKVGIQRAGENAMNNRKLKKKKKTN